MLFGCSAFLLSPVLLCIMAFGRTDSDNIYELDCGIDGLVLWNSKADNLSWLNVLADINTNIERIR